MRGKAFDVAKNSKYDEHQQELTSTVYNFFDKTSSGPNTSGGHIMQN